MNHDTTNYSILHSPTSIHKRSQDIKVTYSSCIFIFHSKVGFSCEWAHFLQYSDVSISQFDFPTYPFYVFVDLWNLLEYYLYNISLACCLKYPFIYSFTHTIVDIVTSIQVTNENGFKINGSELLILYQFLCGLKVRKKIVRPTIIRANLIYVLVDGTNWITGTD